MLAALADLVLPVHCGGCGAPGVLLCRTCGVARPVRVALDGLPVVAAAPYADGLRAALIAYKERGRRDLARPLAALLAISLGLIDCPDARLVPVPSSAAARRERGGDHVVRLARRCGRTSTPLRLGRSVRDSAGLDIAARAANLAGAMRADGPRGSPRAVLVDDIVTTGATLLEAARALRAAGWTVPGAVVVAATARHASRAPARL
jgi:predicted amidophosphoribosyltransferase